MLHENLQECYNWPINYALWQGALSLCITQLFLILRIRSMTLFPCISETLRQKKLFMNDCLTKNLKSLIIIRSKKWGSFLIKFKNHFDILLHSRKAFRNHFVPISDSQFISRTQLYPKHSDSQLRTSNTRF